MRLYPLQTPNGGAVWAHIDFLWSQKPLSRQQPLSLWGKQRLFLAETNDRRHANDQLQLFDHCYISLTNSPALEQSTPLSNQPSPFQVSKMKTSFVIALALVNAAAYASATDCDMSKIESLLYPNATEGLANCENATGIDIFAVNEFPTTEQVTQLSQNVDCADYFNQINQVANSEIQCNVTIQGVPMNFGTLIADFLTGKTGNESDSGSGSIELPSGSDSGSEAAGSAKLDSSATSSGSTAKSASSSNAAAGAASALSLVTYSVAAAIAFALH